MFGNINSSVSLALPPKIEIDKLEENDMHNKSWHLFLINATITTVPKLELDVKPVGNINKWRFSRVKWEIDTRWKEKNVSGSSWLLSLQCQILLHGKKLENIHKTWTWCKNKLENINRRENSVPGNLNFDSEWKEKRHIVNLGLPFLIHDTGNYKQNLDFM